MSSTSNIPTYRVRAWLRAKERNRDQGTTTKISFHLKRTVAELRVEDQPETEQSLYTRIFLNDLRPEHTRVFSPIALPIGLEILLTIPAPKYFYVRAKVTWCQNYHPYQKVIFQHPFCWRVGLEFVFQSDEERMAVLHYCRWLEQEHLRAEIA
jgi:hypothetical protein